MTYLAMLWTFFKIGIFGFGGGYAILAMIQQEVVVHNAWLTQSEFMDVVAISQMTPGPIAINAATFVGYKQAGILGSLLCTFGVVLPSLIIMLIITLTYIKLRQQPWFKNIFQKLRWVTLGLIGAALYIVAKDAFPDWFSLILFLACLVIYTRFKMNPIVLMLIAAVAGMVFA